MMSYPGHSEPWRVWQQAMESDRLHHAWLLSGPPGMGKAAFAQRAANAFIGAAEGGEGAFHPDIVAVRREPKDDREKRKADAGEAHELRRNVTVEQVRGLQRKMSTRPSQGDRRVMIIDPADAMEKGAANALLKLLEEPAPHNVFLLVAHRSQNLLPTIKSRCRLLRFRGGSEDEIADWLRRQNDAPDSDLIENAARQSRGSPGAALDLLHGDSRQVGDFIQALMHGNTLDRGEVIQHIFGVRPDKTRIARALDLARQMIGEALERADRANLQALHRAYGECARLERELVAFNYDTGLLTARIADLLDGIAAPKQPHDA